MTTLLIPPLAVNANINILERLWLECACAYEVFDEPLMEDHLWDRLGIELLERRSEISPYFTEALKLPWPFPEPEPGENTLKTAYAIDWTQGLPAIVVEGLTHERDKRTTRWKHHLLRIEEAVYKRDRNWLYNDQLIGPPL
jgi:hypothetical protein